MIYGRNITGENAHWITVGSMCGSTPSASERVAETPQIRRPLTRK